MNDAFITRRYQLTPAQYERLRALAAARHVAEDEIVQEALELLLTGTLDDRRDWSFASADALERVWDNPDDARYDDWRELYAIEPR
ncbi:MAG: hypothetical protein C0506_04865 [Anaerolinea sp.]|nr:hypothetical protein [Anaerolinea sp.]